MNIKTLLSGFVIFFLLTAQAFAQKSITVNTLNKQVFNIQNRNTNNFDANFSFNELKFSEFLTSDELFTQLNIDGFGKSYTAGAPDLPVYVQVISVPANVNLSLDLLNFNSNTYNLTSLNINNSIKPATQSMSKNDDFVDIKYKKGASYNNNSYSDLKVVELKEIGVMRDMKLYELVYHPVVYNAIQNKIKLRSNVNIMVSWQTNAFIPAKWDFTNEHNHSLTSANKTKTKTVGETFVIVSPADYKETLQPFVKWKKQMGFYVIEAYIGEQIATNNKNTIKEYLKNLYENPAEGVLSPSYLIIVGDVIEIPAWNGTTDSHVTDLYYAEYTGDFLPELYYGRFSVTNTEQLQTVIEKTLFVEKGAGSKNEYQNNHLLVSGVDANMAPVYGNGAINYMLQYYSLEDFGITPSYYLYGSGSPIISNSSQARQAILNDYSAGTGITYYTAHCSSNGWAGPSFIRADISGLENQNMYPLMIGNCCQSLQFNLSSFGEDIVRAEGKGAVAYIGATDYSYWDEDYFWSVGFTSNIIAEPNYEDTDLGSFDAWFHTHNEAEEDRAYNVGQILNVGNMAVQSSSSSLKGYYWEIYQIMGDPSLVPAKYQTQTISANYNSYLIAGQSALTVETEKYAIVSLFGNDELLSVGSADGQGVCELSFNPLQEIGEKKIEIVVSLPDYSPLIDYLNVIAPDGPFLIFKGVDIDDSQGNNNDTADFDESLLIHLKVKNFGTETATNTKIVVSTNSEWITEPITNVEVEIGNIETEELVISTNTLDFTLKNNVPNQEAISFTATLTYNNDKTSDFEFEIVVNAPVIEKTNFLVDQSGIGNLDGIIDSDESVSLQVSFANAGMVQVSNTVISFESSNSNLLTILSNDIAGGGFDAKEAKDFEVQVKAGADIFMGSQVDINYTIKAGDDSQYIFKGYITVTLGGDPEYIMGNDTVEIISGYFYDTGGADGKYSNNESYVMTFLPHNDNQGIMIDFLEFNVESSGAGCRDELKIYNGINIDAPLMGAFCNSNIKDRFKSQNNAGALTFEFTSDGQVPKDGWQGYISSANRYNVTFKLTDGIDMIDNAVVEFVNSVGTTLNDGVVLFENILSKTDKNYSVKKDGYLTVNDVVGDINSDTTITVLIHKLPDICFTIFENAVPLQGVSVFFDNVTLLSDEDGKTTFIDVEPGQKTFVASLEGYNDTTGVIQVSDIDMCYSLNMAKKLKYNLKFIISNESGFLSGADVVIEGVNISSNENGEAIFEGLYADSYNYTINKDGYQTISNSIDVVDTDVVVEHELDFIAYSVTFNIENNGDAVAGAAVTVKGEEKLSSDEGQVIFTGIDTEDDIPFTILKDGFNDFNGTFNIDSLNVNLNIELTVVGISDNHKLLFSVYPNPLHNSKELNITSQNSISELKIFSYSGWLLVTKTEQSKEFKIDISEFTSGIYILQVKINGNWHFKKVIVE